MFRTWHTENKMLADRKTTRRPFGKKTEAKEACSGLQHIEDLVRTHSLAQVLVRQALIGRLGQKEARCQTGKVHRPTEEGWVARTVLQSSDLSYLPPLSIPSPCRPTLTGSRHTVPGVHSWLHANMQHT
uniref:Uncharacterized protein n=1 Tax=Sphaerodactylus townsendi TaxID=933632 RepID=A0ACB8EQD6_9SAUR